MLEEGTCVTTELVKVIWRQREVGMVGSGLHALNVLNFPCDLIAAAS